MKHCVLLKLAPGADPVKVQEKLWKTFQKLDGELDWLTKPVICRRCMDTQSDYDMMLVVDLDGEERIQAYMNHPLREKLAKNLADEVVARATFDHY